MRNVREIAPPPKGGRGHITLRRGLMSPLREKSRKVLKPDQHWTFTEPETGKGGRKLPESREKTRRVPSDGPEA